MSYHLLIVTIILGTRVLEGKSKRKAGCAPLVTGVVRASAFGSDRRRCRQGRCRPAPTRSMRTILFTARGGGRSAVAEDGGVDWRRCIRFVLVERACLTLIPSVTW